MSDEKEMSELAAAVNVELNKLLPKGMKGVILLYDESAALDVNGKGQLMTLANTHPINVREILKLGLEILEMQISAMELKPANDVPAAAPSVEPPRCRFCARPVETGQGTCRSCAKMSAPQGPGG
jgi:hypothetical protein